MARPAHPTLVALAVAGTLAVAACLVTLIATQEDAEAQFPGENGRIAFIGNPSQAGWEIYTMLPDGSDRRQLTSGIGDAFSPAWSPDGTRIAFHSARQGYSEIFTMNADGSGLKQITPTDQIPNGDPDWSPDGTKIVFSDTDRGIHVMDADGSDVKRLTNGGEALDMRPVWSPDGTKIAFERQRERGGGIHRHLGDERIRWHRSGQPDVQRSWHPRL